LTIFLLIPQLDSNKSWLLSTFKSLCTLAQTPETFQSIEQQFLLRGFLHNPPLPGSPFSQVYSSIELLGEGGYGRVSKVQNLIDRQIYALKVIEIPESEVSSAVQEVQCLARPTSPRIVRYYTSWLQKVLNLFLFTFKWNPIHGILSSKYLNNRVTVDLQWTLSVIRELALALNEIHEAGVIHRDIRPENVIIREDGGICVIDFGISSFHEKECLDTIPERVGSNLY
jgi:serine/threonine protein kinase